MISPNPDAKEIFAEALALTDSAQRRAYLDRTCASNATLRDEVESLLRAHKHAGEFLGETVLMNADDEQVSHDVLRRDFSFRHVDLSNPEERGLLTAVEEALWRRLGQRFVYDRHDAMRNEDLTWISQFFIGSSGFLVEHKNLGIIELGSGFGDIVVWVWAYYKGLLGRESPEGGVDLVIEKVGDGEKARKLIESFSTPRIAREALASFATGNGLLRGVRPGFRWWDLKNAEEEGWFKFSVKPLNQFCDCHAL